MLSSLIMLQYVMPYGICVCVCVCVCDLMLRSQRNNAAAVLCCHRSDNTTAALPLQRLNAAVSKVINVFCESCIFRNSIRVEDSLRLDKFSADGPHEYALILSSEA